MHDHSHKTGKILKILPVFSFLSDRFLFYLKSTGNETMFSMSDQTSCHGRQICTPSRKTNLLPEEYRAFENNPFIK
ncbi:hypothetical protein BRW84_04930 [Oxalobacter formigenes OXCC13]|uniref:Uncharacterized protein n=1 Tax=Oxalobacter formigenes OXCC13 TaxID=556269 RepID=C3XA32_OXAFO|nr:hypothetical protein BRW84_04930 [Oxalobacter formigenes OXCC13]EEO30058.1 hypothetical protein OFBG_01086 [Oxalobacter formigenes OXCC13]